MRVKRFGGGGQQASVIGQGTWYLDAADRKTAVATLRRGLDAGMTHIDTAEMYGDAELVIGEALANRRDEIFLVSKVLPQNASRAGVRKACERSLSRLGTDRLDCYLLHWRGSHPLADTVATFEELKREGKILSWGVSNFDADDLAEVAALSPRGAIACNQVLYHLGERAIEHDVLPWCEANDVAVVAYSPFGHGDFPGADTPGGRALAAVGQDRGATPRQVALAFLTSRRSVLAIPKASSPEHAEENARAGNVELSEAEIARIDAALPRGPRPRFLPML